MAITVPTIDEITGHTVMVKMRSLIKSYIAFATEISENVPTREEIGEAIAAFLGNYYTKEEVDEIIENIDLSDYYTKSQADALLDDKANVATTYTKSQVDSLVSPKADASDVYTKSQTDALISPKADASNVYTKTQVDNLVSPKANSSDVYTKTETDNLLTTKQDNLSAISPIQIIDNSVSFKDLVECSNEQIADLINLSGNSATLKNDVYIVFKAPNSNDYTTKILLKGLTFNWTSSPSTFRFLTTQSYMYSILGNSLFSNANTITADLTYTTISSNSGLIYFSVGTDTKTVSKGTSNANVRVFVRA